MLRKALILGMVFILALSLLAVSMITCFTYDAEADVQEHCGWVLVCVNGVCQWFEICIPIWHTH